MDPAQCSRCGKCSTLEHILPISTTSIPGATTKSRRWLLMQCRSNARLKSRRLGPNKDSLLQQEETLNSLPIVEWGCLLSQAWGSVRWWSTYVILWSSLPTSLLHDSGQTCPFGQIKNDTIPWEDNFGWANDLVSEYLRAEKVMCSGPKSSLSKAE